MLTSSVPSPDMANIGEVAADVPGVLSTTIPAMAPALWIRLACYTHLYWLANKYVTSFSILLRHLTTVQTGQMPEDAPIVITSAVNSEIGCEHFSLNQNSVKIQER
jgi:hypothetical protein